MQPHFGITADPPSSQTELHPSEERLLDYWRKELDGAPVLLALPTDRPRPAMRSFCRAVEKMVLPEPLLAALQALSQRESVSLFMTLLAAFEILLHRYTGVEDMIVGSPVAGRNRTESEGLIGFFANLLVLRADLSGDPAFSELLSRVREVTRGAYAHQDLPFERLVRELRPERDSSYHPLRQVVFAQDVAIETQEIGGVSLELEQVSSGASKFDLSVRMTPGKAGLEVSADYSTDLFERETIVRLLGCFKTLLEGVAANPRERTSTLPLLTEPERHQLLVEWNRTRTEYPRSLCIHQLFEAQA